LKIDLKVNNVVNSAKIKNNFDINNKSSNNFYKK